MDERRGIVEDGLDKPKRYSGKASSGEIIISAPVSIRLKEEETLPPKELIPQHQEKPASLKADIDRILTGIAEILGADLVDTDE